MKWHAFIYRWLIRSSLTIWYLIEKVCRCGAFGPNRAAYIKKAYQPGKNRVKNLLYQYHVKQFHESSCSVASVAAVTNSLLTLQGKSGKAPVTQQDLLDRVRAEHWKERMSEDGYDGKRGLPLDVLGNVLKDSLNVFGVTDTRIDIVRANSKVNPDFEDTLFQRLEQYETQHNCLIVSHFDQGSFLPEFHIPHISPVGGFDRKSRAVTMLDVDPEQIYPYRISFETFCKGLSFDYHHLFKPFGYDCGGYVFIEF